MKKITALFVAGILCCSLLSGCSSALISASNVEGQEMSDFSVSLGASVTLGGKSSFYNVNDTGIFFLRNNKIQFYDFASEQSYVLCNKANCRHSDRSCTAYYSYLSPEVCGVKGVGAAGDFLYMTKMNQDNNTWELLQMDLTGENQRVISSLEVGDYAPEHWVISEVAYAYYTKNMAWLVVDYHYLDAEGLYNSVKQNCVVGIELSGGKQHWINRPALDHCSYELVSLSADYAICLKEWPDIVQLSREDFVSALNRGEYQQFAGTSDPYAAYFDWYSKNYNVLYEYLLFDIAAGQLAVINSGEARMSYDAQGDLAGYTKTRVYMDQTASGEILYYDVDDDYTFDGGGGTDVYLWSPATDEAIHLLHINNGTPSFTAWRGSLFLYTTNQGTQLIYREFSEDDSYKTVYLFDIASGTSTALFEGETDTGFNMAGETRNAYFGTFYEDDLDELCMIAKEDYMQGNFDAAVKLKL